MIDEASWPNANPLHRHGTGHGVGAYLKVHEGPILVRMTPESGKLQAGMFFSDEPGFYKVRVK